MRNILIMNTAQFLTDYITLNSKAGLNPQIGRLLPVIWKERSNSPAYSVAILLNAFISKHGMVVGRNQTAIRDSIYYEQHLNLLMQDADLHKQYAEANQVTLQGNFASLVGPWCDGFWHWMMEFLPRAVILEQAGFQGEYLISKTAPGFVLESLKLIGITQPRTIPYDTDDSVRMEKLWLPTRLSIDQSEHYLFLLSVLRGKLLEHVTPVRKDRRLYISRKEARNQRRVVNEDELTKLLADFGFEVVTLERLPLRDQISLMAEADWLIGGSGAGILHCLFMHPGSYVVELFSPNYINPCMFSAVKLLDHDYTMIPGYNNRAYTWGEDIQAYLPAIQLHLEHRLGKRPNFDWMTYQ